MTPGRGIGAGGGFGAPGAANGWPELPPGAWNTWNSYQLVMILATNSFLVWPDNQYQTTLCWSDRIARGRISFKSALLKKTHKFSKIQFRYFSLFHLWGLRESSRYLRPLMMFNWGSCLYHSAHILLWWPPPLHHQCGLNSGESQSLARSHLGPNSEPRTLGTAIGLHH